MIHNTSSITDALKAYQFDTGNIGNALGDITKAGDFTFSDADIGLLDLLNSRTSDGRLKTKTGQENALLHSDSNGLFSSLKQLLDLITSLLNSDENDDGSGSVLPGGGYRPVAYRGNAGGNGNFASFLGPTSSGGNTIGPVQRGDGNWMKIARGEMGQTEIPGAGSNSRIEGYHATTSMGAANDDVPWCSSFVNAVLERAGIKGTDSASAISWKNWGQRVNGLTDAREGDVVVLHRRGGGPNDTHVGFLVRGNNGQITLLGGNQGNTVKESSFNLGEWEVVALRRPRGNRSTA